MKKFGFLWLMIVALLVGCQPQPEPPDITALQVIEHTEEPEEAPVQPAPVAVQKELEVVELQFSEADFKEKAIEVFAVAGYTDCDVDNFVISEITDNLTDKTVVEIAWEHEEGFPQCRFFKETGQFKSLFNTKWSENTTAVVQTMDEAMALATELYEALPVEQGYVYQTYEIYDEQYWSFYFYKEVAPDVYSPYEAVTLSINPVTGQLANAVQFCFPLQVEYDPTRTALSLEDAEEIAQSYERVDISQHTLESARIGVTMSQAYDEPYSNLVWVLTYDRFNAEGFDNKIQLSIDLYTGDVLLVDRTA